MSWVWARYYLRMSEEVRETWTARWRKVRDRTLEGRLEVFDRTERSIGVAAGYVEQAALLAWTQRARADIRQSEIFWSGEDGTEVQEVWDRLIGQWRAVTEDRSILEAAVWDSRPSSANMVGWEWSVTIPRLGNRWGRRIQFPTREAAARGGVAEGEGLRLIGYRGDRTVVPHVPVTYRGSQRRDAPGPISWGETIAELEEG